MLDAFIISVDEPQLEECVKRVYSQTVPFANVFHVNNVVPEYEAHNQAMVQLKSDWAMGIGGDFILIPEAHEVAIDHVKNIKNDRIIELLFGLYDSFLKRNICCCSVIRTSAYKDYLYKDRVRNDTEAGQYFDKCGYSRNKYWRNITLGTHFSNPTEKQVFCRFYIRGVKAAIVNRNKPYINTVHELKELFKKTNDDLYQVAMSAFKLGHANKDYKGSHNKNTDSEIYEKWKASL